MAKRQIIEYEGRKMRLTYAIHERMMRHYAIAEFLGIKNLSGYFRLKVFPNVSLDRPYEKAKDYWITDCHIKKYFDEVLKGFEKAHSIMGQGEFRKGIDKLLIEVNSMAGAAVELWPKSPKNWKPFKHLKPKPRPKLNDKK